MSQIRFDGLAAAVEKRSLSCLSTSQSTFFIPKRARRAAWTIAFNDTSKLDYTGSPFPADDLFSDQQIRSLNHRWKLLWKYMLNTRYFNYILKNRASVKIIYYRPKNARIRKTVCSRTTAWKRNFIFYLIKKRRFS